MTGARGALLVHALGVIIMHEITAIGFDTGVCSRLSEQVAGAFADERGDCRIFHAL